MRALFNNQVYLFQVNLDASIDKAVCFILNFTILGFCEGNSLVHEQGLRRASSADERMGAEKERMAPRVGFEPTTSRLTAGCSTTELPRNIGAPSGAALGASLYQVSRARQPVTRKDIPSPVTRFASANTKFLCQLGARCASRSVLPSLLAACFRFYPCWGSG